MRKGRHITAGMFLAFFFAGAAAAAMFCGDIVPGLVFATVAVAAGLRALLERKPRP